MYQINSLEVIILFLKINFPFISHRLICMKLSGVCSRVWCHVRWLPQSLSIPYRLRWLSLNLGMLAVVGSMPWRVTCLSPTLLGLLVFSVTSGFTNAGHLKPSLHTWEALPSLSCLPGVLLSVGSVLFCLRSAPLSSHFITQTFNFQNFACDYRNAPPHPI